MKCLNTVALILGMTFFFGCKQDKAIPTKSNETYLVRPGDIIVVNGTSRSLILLDSNGNYKTVLYDLDNIAESIYDVALKKDTNEIIFTVNGSPRVGAVSLVNGAYRTLIADANLTGALKGLTQLQNGDILVSEISNIERFTTTGVRRTSVAGVTWPNTLGGTSTTAEQLFATADGGFIVCSSGSDNVKRYTQNAVIVGAAVVSGIAGTTDAFGCIELADGKIAMAFNGTTDTIRTVSAAMTGIATIYSDLAVLASPRTLTQALNGNILIVDSGYNQIVEITTTGTFVRTLGGSLIGTPNAVFSVPNY
ncbi:hypothetical protein SHI21_03765 [Bacteriovorax sp. PP10]|uniref:Lipoprotein n=1 Tax=Bacteriovorax antarcticus TaxID=3088717 RepID=A0ABU5VQH3_9BACT|nr:hypothetical protein [Bacteriovorax sp. PP10]MEA9355299.1 hypothetical protein [Bacteriovorax sp. PP10]